MPGVLWLYPKYNQGARVGSNRTHRLKIRLSDVWRYEFKDSLHLVDLFVAILVSGSCNCLLSTNSWCGCTLVCSLGFSKSKSLL